MESFKNILLVSATELEVKPLLDTLGQPVYTNTYLKEYYLSQNTNLDVIVTGVGIPFTVYKMMRIFSRIKYDLVINIGIAGSFNRNITIGDIVNVGVEEFADLGIEEDSGFVSVFEKGFVGNNEAPFKEGKLSNPHLEKYTSVSSLQKVNGITVNTAHSKSDSTANIKKKFNADVESMEGAAVFYVCLLEKTP